MDGLKVVDDLAEHAEVVENHLFAGVAGNGVVRIVLKDILADTGAFEKGQINSLQDKTLIIGIDGRFLLFQPVYG